VRLLSEVPGRDRHDRSRPRLWHHDYLHLRPIADELERRLGASHACDVLDLGCGESPYRRFFDRAGTYVRVDLNREARPDVIARSEALPFHDGAFDGVLSTQLLQLTDDPVAMSAELARVVRPGGASGSRSQRPIRSTPRRASTGSAMPSCAGSSPA
jgi:ubiquinone/menaquinone biosynthesis C-methylase UbiE